MGRMAYAVPRSNAKQFPPGPSGAFALEPALVPPNTDGNARFHMEFFQNVLHMFLHGARATSENFADLAVPLSSRDPFYDFVLALG